MSTRERWTVYPLLFLALGAALRDKMTSSIDVQRVFCEELIVAPHHGTSSAGPTLRLSPNQLVLYGANHKPVVVAASEQGAGTIVTHTSEGKPQVVLKSTKRGGLVTAIDWRRKVYFTLGHDDEKFGIFGYDLPHGITYTVLLVHSTSGSLSKPPGKSDGVRPDAKRPDVKQPPAKRSDAEKPAVKSPAQPAESTLQKKLQRESGKPPN